MSISPAPAPPFARSLRDPISHVSLPAGSIALIVNTRNNLPLSLIPALVRYGFTSAERPIAEAVLFVQNLRPGLLVAIVDPAHTPDAELVRMASRSGAYVLLLAPSSESFARGLNAGADACLADGVDDATLEAQIGAIRRRLTSAAAEPLAEPELVVGEFRLDRSSRRLHKGTVVVPLTAMEFSILAHLAQNAGKTTSALELLHQVTGRVHRDTEAAQTIKVYIRRLRQKLQRYGGSVDLITTVRGYGYMVERPAGGS